MRLAYHKWACFGLIAATALLVGSCGGKPRGVAAPPPWGPLCERPLVAQCEPGIPGGRLVIANVGDPKTFNPITANEGSSEDIYRFLFGSLLNLNWVTQAMEPGLAEAWSVAPDNMTWTFKLRPGLRWSDGQPLTADDVVFTWQVIYDTNIVNVTVDLFRIDKKDFTVTKVDDVTVRVVTPGIYAPFLENFGTVPVLPRHKLARAVAEKRFESAYGIDTPPADLVGSGAFRLKKFKPGEYTLLERNPHFYEVDKKGTRLPYLDNIIYMVVPDMNAISLRFLSGESDVNDTVQPFEVDRYEAKAKQGQCKVLELGLGLESSFFWFNQNTNVNPKTGRPLVDPVKLQWFRNTKFRQAISYAVDRGSIVRAIYAGRAEPSYGYLTKANKKWYDPHTPAYPYDPGKAKALLGELGLKDRNGDGILEDEAGHKVEFTFNTNTGNGMRDRIAVMIQHDLKQLGVGLIYQPLEFNTLVDKIDNTRDYECVLLSLAGGGTDPSSHMNVVKSDAFTHQWFPLQKAPSTAWEARLDWLMNAQLMTLDFQERKKYFDEVQMILGEQMPMIYTVSPYSYAAVRPDLANLRPSVLNYYRVTWNAEELYFKPPPPSR